MAVGGSRQSAGRLPGSDVWTDVLAVGLDAADLQSFVRSALPVVAGVVGADVVGYTEVPSAREGLHILYPGEARDPTLDEPFARNADHHPLVEHVRRTGSLEPIAISDLISQRELHRLGIYAEFFKPMGLEEQLAVPVPNDEGIPIAVAFNRVRPYGPRAHDLVAPLGALFGACRGLIERRQLLARAVELLGSEPDGGARRGILAIDRRGCVEIVSQSMTGALEDTLGARVVSGRAAPPQLGVWLARARQDTRCRLPGRTCAGTRLALSHAGDAGGCELFVVEDLPAAALGLTARQWCILAEVADGKADKQIARDLAISVRTVQKHLERTYRTLGVQNRTAAATRWLEAASTPSRAG